jgi:hypothetical protein
MDRAARIRRRDEHCTLLCQEAGHVAADGAEALYDEPRAVERDPAERSGHLGGMAEPEARRPDLVQRDATERPRQADHSANLVANPGHALLVGAHVGGEDVVVDAAQRLRHGANQRFLAFPGEARIRPDDCLAAAVGQAGSGVLEGHGPRQAQAFLQAHVRRHAHAADGRSRRGVIDHQDACEAHRGLVNVDDPGRAKLVRKLEQVVHHAPLQRDQRTRSMMSSLTYS